MELFLLKSGGGHGVFGDMGSMSRDKQEYSLNVVLLESGGIAQLAEHELCKLGVTGSIPVASTLRRASLAQGRPL